jgi:hypothetical protein
MIKKISFYVLICIIVAAVVVTIVALTKPVPSEVQEINYTFRARDVLGFNLDADKLHFGGGPPGTTLQRDLEINSSIDGIVNIQTIGPGSLIADKNNFPVTAGSSEIVEFNLLIPPGLPEGDYEGTIFITFLE